MEENKTPFDGVALLPSQVRLKSPLPLLYLIWLTEGQVFGEVIHKCDSADATNNSLGKSL